MSTTIQITESVNLLEIETSISNTVNNLEIEYSEINNIEINSGFTASIVYASDVMGLSNFIDNFMDSYNIDCGSPQHS